jgi:uncharacterized protein YegL
MAGAGHVTAGAPAAAAASETGRLDVSLSDMPAGHGSGGDLLVNVSVVPPARGARAPITFIAVLDVSGSMQLEATVKTAGGETSEGGFTRLDLVKHSLNVVIASLQERDDLAVVTFSNTAAMRLAPTAMDARGKATARAVVAGLEADGQTNLWAGIHTALEAVSAGVRHADSNVVVLVLTDGEPNVDPPRGLMPTLTRWIADHPRARFSMHTFGFGFALDSGGEAASAREWGGGGEGGVGGWSHLRIPPAAAGLLTSIAAAGRGQFGYIPDASILGSLWVNFLAGAITTAFLGARVNLTPAPDVEVVSVWGWPGAERSPSGSISVDVETVAYGQPRDLLVEVKTRGGARAADAPLLTVAFACSNVAGEASATATWGMARTPVGYHFLRLSAVRLLRQVRGLEGARGARDRETGLA